MKLVNLLNLDNDSYKKLADSEKYKNVIKRSFSYLWNTCSLEEIRDLLGCYYLFEKEEDDSIENIYKLLDTFEEDFYNLSSKDDSFILNREELSKALSGLENGEAVIVREVAKADLCGHILFTTDHKIFIEVLRGGLLGFWQALDIPTYYVLDKQGNIISKEENIISKYYDFDTQEGKWVLLSDNQNEKVILSENQLKQLFELLLKINKNEIYMKLEWYYKQGRIYLYDIVLPLGLGIVE